jgi:hypothetical protein
MYIEGAEVAVFRDNYSWLDRVEKIAIELHDDSIFGSATDTFYNAVRGQEFEFSRSADLTICSRPVSTVVRPKIYASC